MSLEKQVNQILNNFDKVESTRIIEILTSIQPHLKSKITQEYLRGKIQTVADSPSEIEKKKICKTLKPYFYWYLQGK
jgi:hypothetical protein